VATLTITRESLAMHGVRVEAMRQMRELAPDVARALRALLEAQGFDLTAPISVRELPLGQVFHLTQ
jgi:hypothetical protein